MFNICNYLHFKHKKYFFIKNYYNPFLILLKYFTKSYDDTEKLNVIKPTKKLSKLIPKKIKFINTLEKSNIHIIYLLGILNVILIVLPNIFKTIQILTI